MSEGIKNPSADAVKRQYKAWTDTQLTQMFPPGHPPFVALQCDNCCGREFQVIVTDTYETSALCIECGSYFIVHCG